jgi:hypothetical protein
MATFGVTLVTASGVVVESVDTETKAEFKRQIASDGSQFQTHAFDKTNEFSIRGRGPNPYEAGGAVSISGITGGKTIVTSAKHGTKNDDFETFEASGTNYPYAT